MSEALKPCPFCEKTASVINCPEEWNEGAVVVACDSCGGSAPVVFGVKDDPNPHARALWNTRPIEYELRAELVRWLEALADTPPEALWELREPRMSGTGMVCWVIWGFLGLLGVS